MLVETPDKMLMDDGSPLGFVRSDARVFGFINGKRLVYAKTTHFTDGDPIVHDTLFLLLNKIEDEDILSPQKYLNDEGVYLDGPYESLRRGTEQVDAADENTLARRYLMPSGRIWLNAKAISFWASRHQVKSHHIKAIAKAYGFSNELAEWKVEFIDVRASMNHPSLQEFLSGNNRGTGQRSATEIAELMKKKHLGQLSGNEREVIRGLTAGFGSDRAHQQAAAGGFNSIAQLRARMSLSEEFLTEDPDKFVVGKYDLGTFDTFAHGFGFLRNGTLISGTGAEQGYETHQDLAMACKMAYNEFTTEFGKANVMEAKKFFVKRGIRVSCASEADWTSMLETECAYVAQSKKRDRELFFPAGRIWLLQGKDVQANPDALYAVVSFWNSQAKVPNEKLKRVLDFFNVPRNAWNRVAVEYINFKAKELDALPTAIHVIDGRKVESNLTDSEIAELMKKKHLGQLNQREQRVIRDLTRGFGSQKASALAKAGGFTSIAQMRALASLSESKRHKKDILQDDYLSPDMGIDVRYSNVSDGDRIRTILEDKAEASGMPLRVIKRLYERANTPRAGLKLVHKFISGDGDTRLKHKDLWKEAMENMS